MDEKKIHFTQKHVDESWKESISKEKGEERPGKDSSQVTFSNFVTSLGIQALVLMGELKAPGSEKAQIDLAGAQETIDLLVMLKEKSKSNLTTDEEKLLDSLIADLQFKFVQRKMS